MSEIAIHIVGVVLGALALRMLGLHKRTVVVRTERKVSWFWNFLRLGGKFLFYYGLLIFLLNWIVNGLLDFNTRLGISFLTLGIVFWIIGATRL